MVRLLKPGGVFYLSTPIGQERVEFNAHHVFDPHKIIHCVTGNGLQLKKLTVIGSGGVMREVQANEDALKELGQSFYNLGIFVFVKPKDEASVL